MTVSIQNAKYVYDESIGHFVNQKHKMVAEILLDIDPELVVMWEPERRNYAIAHMPGDRDPYIIFTVEEDAMDHRVIEKILQARADAQGKPGSLAEKVERAEAAKQLLQLKETEELIEQERDKARFLWTTPLHNPRMDGKVWRL